MAGPTTTSNFASEFRGKPGDYAHADASVPAGDLTASAFGVNKDGLFRSFEKKNPSGKYRLQARVGAGDLVLK